jgi:hypothetical protein
MLQIPVQDLRRVMRSLQGLRGRRVGDCIMRSDLRQLRIELDDGEILVIALESDDAGRPHLAVDVVAPTEDMVKQLEVGLESRDA